MSWYHINKNITLEWFPNAQYSSATLTIYDAENQSILTDEAATVDSLDVQVETGNARSRELLISDTLSTGAVVIGRRYRLEDQYGNHIITTVSGIDGQTVLLRDRMRTDFSGGRLKGVRLSCVFSSALNNVIRRRCRAQWSFGTYTKTEIVNFVPLPFELNLTEEDVNRAAIAFGEQDTATSQYGALLEMAEMDIIAYLNGRQIFPDRVIERAGLRTAAAYRVLQLRWVADIDRFEKFEALYKNALAMFDSSKAWVERDDELTLTSSAASGTGEDQGLPPKRIKVC